MLFIAAGTVSGTVYNYPGKTVTIFGSGIPGQSKIAGTSPAITIVAGNLAITGIEFTMAAVNDPTILVNSGNLKLRSCILNESAGGSKACLLVTGGTADAGTSTDYGLNKFLVNGQVQPLKTILWPHYGQ